MEEGVDEEVEEEVIGLTEEKLKQLRIESATRKALKQGDPEVIHVADVLLDEIDRLREELKELEFVDAHGCVSGDCPHEYANECCLALGKELTFVANNVGAALHHKLPIRKFGDETT